MDAKKLRILFLGTPDFAAASLENLVIEGANVVAVVTAPDKPAGRGLQIQKSAVKLVAEKYNLHLFQPPRLKDPELHQALKDLNLDLGIVVAFRMLPEAVWQMPRLGTFNLHASLLPKYRGAAPIHWAIMQGEKETGITTFFLKHEIDTGDLLMQEKISIDPQDNVGSLYQKMMIQGADLVWKTVQGIANQNLTPFPQDESLACPAPKIFKETCRLDFSQSVIKVHNQVRGLSPSPGAFLVISGKQIKIFKGIPTHKDASTFPPGSFNQIENGQIGIATADFWYLVEELQPEGKRKMTAKEFLAGHTLEKI